MDRNLLLAFALSFGVLTLWSLIYQPPRPGQAPGAGVEADRQAPGAALEPSAVQQPLPMPALPQAAALPGATGPAAPQPVRGELLRVETDLYRAELTTAGAGLHHWELVQYHQGVDRGREPVVLTMGRSPWQVALLAPFSELAPQTGVPDLSSEIYELESSDGYAFVFSLTRGPVTIRKTYSFQRDGYGLDLRLEVSNQGDVPIEPRFAVRMPAHVQELPEFAELSLVALQDGELEYEALAGAGRPGFLGMSAAQSVYDYPGSIEWAGLQTSYFLSVVMPDNPGQADARFLVAKPGESAVVELFFEPVQVPPGQRVTREYRAYLGPKEPERLAGLGGELARSIDLGWSWVRPMTGFFGWMLGTLHSMGLNYGVAIIVLTILVRVVTAPLTNRQMRSMERMRALSPRLKELQEKYKDDRQKQSEETMRLYRQEKVNPLGGCLPMVLQLPVFIGLFYALRSSIELRQAPFISWIDDLSAPETLFFIPGIDIPVRVLPLVMGATMVLQQRMTPMPSMDPAQARMMMTVMPIMMTVVFYQFPSGLVLYWMVSNVLAIAHQRWIGRNIAQSA